jgi:hypothetical protein
MRWVSAKSELAPAFHTPAHTYHLYAVSIAASAYGLYCIPSKSDLQAKSGVFPRVGITLRRSRLWMSAQLDCMSPTRKGCSMPYCTLHRARSAT